MNDKITDAAIAQACPQCGRPDEIYIQMDGVRGFQFVTMTCSCGYGECAPYDYIERAEQPEVNRRFFRARELDAEKGGRCDVPGVISAYCCINGCKHMADAATPPESGGKTDVDEEAAARAFAERVGEDWDQMSDTARDTARRMAGEKT